jgi:ornithine cyclodeaminase/alanine dehydrogenase-like protein (mu-crystallin family)
MKSVHEICTLGSVTLGESQGRISDTEITVFDSPGIAIQDLAMAHAVFKAVQRMDLIQYIGF